MRASFLALSHLHTHSRIASFCLKFLTIRILLRVLRLLDLIPGTNVIKTSETLLPSLNRLVFTSLTCRVTLNRDEESYWRGNHCDDLLVPTW